jgi:biotin transporter BioY
MYTPLVRRIAMAALTLAVLFTVAATIATADRVGSARLILAGGGFLFGFLVLRLVETMLMADRRHSRRARQWLIVASMIPALVLIPSALESSARPYRPLILVGAMLWIGLALSLTSVLLAHAHRAKHERPTRSRRTRDKWMVPVGGLSIVTAPAGRIVYRNRRARV